MRFSSIFLSALAVAYVSAAAADVPENIADDLVAGGVVVDADSVIDVKPDPSVEKGVELAKAGLKLKVGQVLAHDNVPSSQFIAQNEEVVEDADEQKSYDSFIMSVSMIVVSEIGDKTFLIAALMAMRNSRLVVFSAAFSSLVVMTVLSGLVGHALPTLISQRLTQFMAAALFVIFGVKLLREGLEMSKDIGVDEEMAEVEEELASSNINGSLENMEHDSSYKPANKQWLRDFGIQIKDLASFVLSPVWIQVFVMTFLGEWGDRSQIATIAMAAGSDYWLVILGAIVGHGVCTAAACIGGKLLAKRISMRNVTLGGAIAFFVFSVLYFYDAYYEVK